MQVHPKSKAQIKRNGRLQAPQEPPLSETGATIIAASGDIILAVARDGTSLQGSADPRNREHEQDQDEAKSQDRAEEGQHMYRVASSQLKKASPYFARLLDPEKFGEGAIVAERHASLKAVHTSFETVPVDELPRVGIVDVGRISPTVKRIRPLMTDFLRALHDQDLSTQTPPMANIANLVVVADRFDALPAMRQYFKSRRLMVLLDAKVQDKSGKSWSEERVRQRLLVGLLMENASWVWSSSLRLIHRGWVGREPDENAALWTDLPMGIEDELLFRRECVLETIQSLQTHFLNLYSSRERQCKLGYDSSAECDLYQLGQMLRFFKRIGTVSVQGSLIATSEPPDPYEGDVFDIVDSLRQAPEYQIDKNHNHCGLRTRLMPLLDLVSLSLTQEIGVCLHCWQDCRHEYAYSLVKRPLIWRRDSAGAGMIQQYKARQAQSHLSKHLDARDLYMATERHWT